MGSSQSAEAAPAPKPAAKVEIPDAAPVKAAMDAGMQYESSLIANTLESLNTQSLISFERCN